MKKIILVACTTGILATAIGASIGVGVTYLHYRNNPVYQDRYVTKQSIEELKNFQVFLVDKVTTDSIINYTCNKQVDYPANSPIKGSATFETKKEIITKTFFIENNKNFLDEIYVHLRKKFYES
jgi:hypothetical protein